MSEVSSKKPVPQTDAFSAIKEEVRGQYALSQAVGSLCGHLHLDVFSKRLLPETESREEWISVSVGAAFASSLVSKEVADAYRERMLIAGREYVQTLFNQGV